MKRCYLVRHAQTTWNSENRLQGDSDLPLSPLGHEQAKRLAAFFAASHVQGIFTSPLQRSQQTAQAIAAGNGHGVRPVVAEGLAEMRLGAWEGLTPDEIEAHFQGLYQRWLKKPSSVRIPEAEPLSAFRARVRGTLEKILGAMGEGDYVVVTHGGVIAAVLADLLHADYDEVLRRVRLDNAGVTALECGGGHPYVLWVNATDHLSP